MRSRKSSPAVPTRDLPPSPSREPTTDAVAAGQRPRIHPSGGLASALAGSGLAIAHPASMQRPPVPPLPSLLPQRNNTVSEFGLLPPQQDGRDRHSQSRKLSMNNHNNSQTRLQTYDDREDSSRGSSSGCEDDDEDDEDDDSSDDDLNGVAPVTGFAVASNKRTADFHAMFPTIPEADYLIDDYGCALQRDILLQGRLYISENHVCFHANIFGWTTD
ncbi:hypothetical protein M422DRAFT_267970, partial [Sphaerobolus stellatus SS14]